MYGKDESTVRPPQQFAKSSPKAWLCQGMVDGTNAKIGVHGVGETPVTIPNTEVKPYIGYYTWQIKAWENSTMPNYKRDLLNGGLFYNSVSECSRRVKHACPVVIPVRNSLQSDCGETSEVPYLLVWCGKFATGDANL